MMSKRLAMAAIVALLLLGGTEAFAEYNREAVVEVMRNNLALMGRLREAAGKSDFSSAADHFRVLAEGMSSIRGYTPPKGEKVAWDRSIDQFVSAASRGLKASGDRDPAGLGTALAELSRLMQSGHAMFR